MEELIGLLLVLLFGGIEAWNKAKKKKARKEAGSAGYPGNPEPGPASGRRGPSLPEAWPEIRMDVPVEPDVPVSMPERVVPVSEPVLEAIAAPKTERQEPPLEAEILKEDRLACEDSGQDSLPSKDVLPGTSISLRDAVIASVVLERKYV